MNNHFKRKKPIRFYAKAVELPIAMVQSGGIFMQATISWKPFFQLWKTQYPEMLMTV